MTDIEKLQKFLSPHVPFVSWDYKGHREAIADGHSLYDTQSDWNQTLITKINQTSAQIFHDSMTGGANVILIPESVKELFETLIYFQPEQHEYKFGSLSGRYIVYAIPKIAEKTVEMYNRFNVKEMVTFEETKIFVCKVKNTGDILNPENYLKVGVIRIEQLIEVKLFE